MHEENIKANKYRPMILYDAVYSGIFQLSKRIVKNPKNEVIIPKCENTRKYDVATHNVVDDFIRSNITSSVLIKSILRFV